MIFVATVSMIAVASVRKKNFSVFDFDKIHYDEKINDGYSSVFDAFRKF